MSEAVVSTYAEFPDMGPRAVVLAPVVPEAQGAVAGTARADVAGGGAVSGAPAVAVAAQVASAVALLSARGTASEVEWAVRGPGLADRPAADDDVAAWVEQELRVVEAAERVKAWADSRALAALARLHDAVTEQVVARADRWSHGADGPFERVIIPGAIGMVPESRRSAAAVAADVACEVETATVDEVMLATGLPEGEVRRRLALAVDEDGRGALLRAALAAGGRMPDLEDLAPRADPSDVHLSGANPSEANPSDASPPDAAVLGDLGLAADMSHERGLAADEAGWRFGGLTLGRAISVHQQTAVIHPAQALAVSARMMAAGPDGAVRSHRWFTQALRRQVVVHTPDPVAAHAAAVAARRAYAMLDDVGTGTLTVSGDAARVTAAMERVETIARHLRCQEAAGGCDSRTLEQLRSDVTLDLILYGHTAPPVGETDLRSTWRAAPTAPTGLTGPTTAGTMLGQAPPASVTVLVNLSTLLGIDDACGEIPGYGPIPAVLARQAAVAEGSVWRRLVTDPVIGTALELSTHRYRPTRTMADLVAALDGVCRAPGCTVAAARCDLDHTRPWPTGPTSVGNLAALHRRHHNHKTRGTWRAATDPTQPDPAGAITWTSLARRHFTTTRRRYDDPLDHPVTDVELDAAQALADRCVDAVDAVDAVDDDEGVPGVHDAWSDPPPF